MPKLKDLTGMTFGRLTVIERAGRDKQGNAQWLCRCDCGNEKILRSRHLLCGVTTSCGCDACIGVITHGGSYSRLYRILRGMKTRTNNPNVKDYPRYGGRGIKVCDEWKNDFAAFRDWAMANGYDDRLSIDRIDNDGNYEPSNCRWVDSKAQNNNRRDNCFLTVNGVTHTATEWSRILGIHIRTIRDRLKRSWAPERVLGLECA
jgi:hypothetical protein